MSFGSHALRVVPATGSARHSVSTGLSRPGLGAPARDIDRLSPMADRSNPLPSLNGIHRAIVELIERFNRAAIRTDIALRRYRVKPPDQ